MVGMFLIFIIAFIVLSILLFIFLRIFFQRKVHFSNELLLQKEEIVSQLQNEVKQLQIQKETLIERTGNAESKIEFLNTQYVAYQVLQQEHQSLQNDFTKAGAAIENANEKLLAQKEELNQIGEKFKFEFRNLAQSIMEEKTAKFTEVNEQKMNAILNPLKTQLTDFKQKVEDTYDKESKERFSLEKEVQRLVMMTQQVSLEANNLTTALKGNNKMQGNWGEMILESILENSGLVKNREFFLQQFLRDNAGNVIKDAEGKGLQPDAIIVYPDQRKIVLDSKVSLIAWDEYVSQSDVVEQQKFLREHVKSVRQHIDGLSKKNYPKYALALNYVLMFVPIEPAFLEALKTDTQLWKYAYDK
ncbi:MAG: DNA recombination protein RmuC, partial [Ginsengibacter sp.]